MSVRLRCHTPLAAPQATVTIRQPGAETLNALLPYRPAKFDTIRGKLDPRVGARLLMAKLQNLPLRELQVCTAAASVAAATLEVLFLTFARLCGL